jgi:CDGSH-type Zn-finger protein
MAIEIKLYKNGPIIISNERSQVALCRCGLSANKPMCDGKHVQCEDLPEAEVKLGEFISVEVVDNS